MLGVVVIGFTVEGLTGMKDNMIYTSYLQGSPYQL